MGIFIGLNGFLMSLSCLLFFMGCLGIMLIMFSKLYSKYKILYVVIIFLVSVFLIVFWLGRMVLIWIVDMLFIGVFIVYFIICLFVVKLFSYNK